MNNVHLVVFKRIECILFFFIIPRFTEFMVLQNLGLMRRIMSLKLMIPFFKIDIKKIIF